MKPIDPENSPCIGVCKLENGICIGCNRTTQEIISAGNKYRAAKKDAQSKRMKHAQCRGQGCDDCDKGWITRQ
jgi:predicted Fe-S protein YdhL (DUF1289 family)